MEQNDPVTSWVSNTSRSFRVIVGVILFTPLALLVLLGLGARSEEFCVGELNDDPTESRIYLTVGTIYAFKDDPRGKVYFEVTPDFPVIHLTEKSYCEATFFDSTEEAEAAGYISIEQMREAV